MVGLIVLTLVQDQPKFETWVGAANTDAVFFAKRHCFVESRMIVAVKHCPDLVVFLKRFLSTAAVSSKTLRLGKGDSFFRNGIGNTRAGVGFHLNESA